MSNLSTAFKEEFARALFAKMSSTGDLLSEFRVADGFLVSLPIIPMGDNPVKNVNRFSFPLTAEITLQNGNSFINPSER